jgi:hypothetical protein
MAKRDGKRDLNNNDDEGPMPKKSCQRFKDSYQDTWNFICASKKGETFFHCTVCAIDIACAHATETKAMSVVMLEPKTTLTYIL